MKKHIISILLAFLLVLGLWPLSAFTVFAKDGESVYITISEDGQFYNDKDNNAVAYREVYLSDLQSINLESYGLGDYAYDPDGSGTPQITALQLFIYVHENIMGGQWSDVTVSGNAGSIYFQGGLFGFSDENMTYYYNGAYPEIEPGWGATADQIVLSDGDFLDVAHYSSWSFYSDSAAGFHYFVDGNGNVTHQYSAAAGEAVSVKLKRVGGGFGGDPVTVFESGYPVKYGTTIGTATGTATTDSSGAASITFPTAGTYYVWCDGAEGIDAGEGEAVSSPVSAIVTVTGSTAQTADYKTILNATLEQLATDIPAPAFGTGGGEWTVISLARGGYFNVGNQYFEDYYARVAETVASKAASVNQSGALDNNKSTENSRLIMALAAIGKDPTDVGGVNVLGAYDANGFNWIKKQGINGPIFTLIALDTRNYPTTDTTLRQQCIAFILEKELAGGGWALSGTAADPDITSMALQALVNYKNDANVSAAASRAIDALSGIQKDNGGFYSFGAVNSESIAQVITALSAWGIDADKDSRFVKNDCSALDALLGFYLPEAKGFAHVLASSGESEVNGMATDQACYALVAYDRYATGKTSLYDMSDVKTSSAPTDGPSAAISIPENIENKAGTKFNAVVTLTVIPTDARLFDAIVTVPEGIDVTDVVMGSSIGGGDVQWSLEKETGKLRIVYFDADGGNAITNNAATSPIELMTLKCKLEKTLTDESINLAITGMSFKKSSATDTMLVVDTKSAVAEASLSSGLTFTVKALYTGDNVDLIPASKTAIAVAITGIQEGAELTYNDGTDCISMLYNDAISKKTGVSTYIAMITSDMSLEGFIDSANYTFGTGNADLTFGDINGDGVINAQDALNTVNYWLRKINAPNDDEILAANVTGDSRINTFDVLAIVEYFVDGSEFAIVNYAATVKNTVD